MMAAFTYPYPRPALTVDCVVFAVDEEALRVLLIQRGGEPFKGQWALPGGFVEIDEPLEAAALRELEEETGVKGVALEQLGAFGDVDRDPRGRVVSVVFLGLCGVVPVSLKAGSDAGEARWFAMRRTPPLAFDHKMILEKALRRFRDNVLRRTLLPEFAGPEFELEHLRPLFGNILDRSFEKSVFAEKMLETGLFEPSAGGKGGLYRLKVGARELSESGKVLFDLF